MTVLQDRIRAIHLSFQDGQGKQAVELIDKYGLYDFFADYKYYLLSTYVREDAALKIFAEDVIKYHRIKHR